MKICALMNADESTESVYSVMLPNRLLEGHLASDEAVRAALDRDGVGERISPYGVVRLPRH